MISSKAKREWTRQEARHLLNRAGFGGSPVQIDTFHAMGREGAVKWLLEPEESPDAFPVPDWAQPEAVKETLRRVFEERAELRRKKETLSSEAFERQQRELNRRQQQESREQVTESQAWWIRRMLKSSAPLREKMTLFWHDHFATSTQKVRGPFMMIRQNELFREFAFGNFRELTQRIVRDPAMMIYLDVQRSDKKQPNENFAREVMELFTLGEGHYTEDDVKHAARAFTGYQLDRLSGEVTQSARIWDDGQKTVFGQTGKFNGSDIVKLIFRKPECSEFMARKIWEFFSHEAPADALVKRFGKVLRDANYEMKPMLAEMFLSEEFYQPRDMGNQIKCPVQYLVQMLKELEVERAPTRWLVDAQTQLGQVLFLPPNVAGWDWGKAWINTNTLLARYNIAGNLITGKVDMKSPQRGMMMDAMRERRAERVGNDVTQPDFANIAPESKRNETKELVDHLIARFFSIAIPEKARESFVQYADSKKGVSFTDKELGELCHLMLSTPYYQLS
ncbi:MAG: hypothetical protein RL346_1159 [Verrucomicrobiota bacterium]|jgi:uncharacterized protein (DUF1800 family)